VNRAEELLEPGLVLQFGVPPNRIDLLNRIDGVEFPECRDGKVFLTVSDDNGDFPAYLIGIDQLIRNKDRDDLRFLRGIPRPQR
jgi:hypothetical protein